MAIGSIGAALAIKKLIKGGQLNCTIRYYGTTAEGTIGAKTFLARDGHFDDLGFTLYLASGAVNAGIDEAMGCSYRF